MEVEGDIATAYTLARMVSDIPLAKGGPASVVIFDIHALQARALRAWASWWVARVSGRKS